MRSDPEEAFHPGKVDPKVTLIDFWKWADFDRQSNATRGRIAEYTVAMNLKAAQGIRREWVSYDLMNADGISVEVKSATYVQGGSSAASRQSSSESTPRRPDTGLFAPPPVRRQAAVYVFALQAEKDLEKMDPLNLA